MATTGCADTYSYIPGAALYRPALVALPHSQVTIRVLYDANNTEVPPGSFPASATAGARLLGRALRDNYYFDTVLNNTQTRDGRWYSSFTPQVLSL